MQNFRDLTGPEATDALHEALEADGIKVPTSIQTQGFAPIAEGQHVVLQSGTGTGKTLAYLLPVFERLSQGAAKRAIVLAPSPELGVQILRVADRYKPDNIASGALIPSGSYKQQKARITKSTRFMVGTPGRVLEMYRARKMKNVNILVFDEPDLTLTSKDADYLREIISRPEPRLQVIVVGATLGPATQSFIEESLHNVVWLKSVGGPLQDRIRHLIVGVREGESKDVRVARFMDKNRCKRAFLFAGDDNVISHLYRYLGEHRHKPVTLSRERSKEERNKAVREFGSGQARVLITSDAGARGLDVNDVPWVLHYDVARSAPVYLHRAGRTARAGQEGTSVSFCFPKERARLKAFAKKLGIHFELDGR